MEVERCHKNELWGFFCVYLDPVDSRAISPDEALIDRM